MRTANIADSRLHVLPFSQGTTTPHSLAWFSELIPQTLVSEELRKFRALHQIIQHSKSLFFLTQLYFPVKIYLFNQVHLSSDEDIICPETLSWWFLGVLIFNSLKYPFFSALAAS